MRTGNMSKGGDGSMGVLARDAGDMVLIGVFTGAGLESVGKQSAKVERGLVDLMIEGGARHAAARGGGSVGRLLGLQDPVPLSDGMQTLLAAFRKARQARSVEGRAGFIVEAAMSVIASFDPDRFAKGERDADWRAAIDRVGTELLAAFEQDLRDSPKAAA